MNPREPVHSFEAARRQHLIDATIEALADVGFKAASLSQIAQRAAVSTGLFAHYFGDKDGLLEATLRFMAVRLTMAMRQRLKAAQDARERLYAVPDSALADEEFNRRTSAVWLAFWGQITHSTRYQRIQHIYQQRMLSNLRHDLRPFVPADRVARDAQMIASMIDGVWIRSHASSQQADAAQARALVRALIDELIEAGRRDEAAPGHAAQRRASIRERPVQPTAATSPPGRVRHGGDARLDKSCGIAIERAEAARGAWTSLPAWRRAQALRAAADALHHESAALAAIEARETGRAIALSRAHTLPRAIGILQWAAENVSGQTVVREDLGSRARIERHDGPFGIVAAMGRWSSPLLDAVRHGGPALAAGNALVFQPSRLAPGGCARFVAILEDCGVPPGAFQIVRDETLWQALRARPEVTMREAQVEQAATIMLDGADATVAARAILLGSNPWRLSPDYSETRILATRAGAAKLIEALLAQAGAIRAGDPLDPSARLGRFASAGHAADVARAVAAAERAGARLLATPESHPGTGLTIVDASDCDSPAFPFGLHGPVVALAIDADDDALARRAAGLGLAAIGLIGADDTRARRIIDASQVPFCCIDPTKRAAEPAETSDPCVETLRFAAADRRRHWVYVAHD